MELDECFGDEDDRRIGEEPTDEPGVDFSGSLWPRMSEVELALEDEEELLRSSGGVPVSESHWTGVTMPSS
jgi:hypothetical protein